MFRKQLDFVAIGDVTTDAFIRLKEAEVHCKVNHEDCEICFPFGDKIPFEYVKIVKAVGNAGNATVAAARLGLRSAIVTNLGNDQNGKDCRAELLRNKVQTSLIKTHAGKPTNYHFVLWYDTDRTILVNHVKYDYRLPKMPPTKWIYLTSMAANSSAHHAEIADYIDAHPEVKLAFQPGTFQMELGTERLGRIYTRTDVFVVNKEEAERVLKTDAREIKTLLNGLIALGPKLVLITDDTAGAYMFDGDHYYSMPTYPDPRPALERTGCGDAFASTFVSALALGMAPLEALTWAPVNPMSVAQFVGSQEGLLPRDQIEWWLERAPAEYKPREF